MIMGFVYAELTLRNVKDVKMFERGRIKEREIRQVSLMAMVDTGSGTLVIDELTCKQLGLTIKGLRRSTLADGSKVDSKITEQVEINWKDRQSNCEAMVLPNADETLLGVIPLQDMDVMVYPARGVLVGAHEDAHVRMIK
jgi:clan AA aspartic protease